MRVQRCWRLDGHIQERHGCDHTTTTHYFAGSCALYAPERWVNGLSKSVYDETTFLQMLVVKDVATVEYKRGFLQLYAQQTLSR